MSDHTALLHELVDFLVDARRGTYAIPHGNKLADATEEMVWSRGNWVYRDRYAGNNPYGGHELVWRDDNVVWMMNYYAEVVSDSLLAKNISAEKVYAYQMEVLAQPDPNHLMRGPANHASGDFAYANQVDGDLTNFTGEEIISFQGETVYRMRFHGGVIGN